MAVELRKLGLTYTMTQGYLCTDHWTDAVVSLEAAQEFSTRVTLDESHWKWLLIAVHSAVQGFMVLALEQGNALLVRTDKNAEKWLNAYDAGTPYSVERMDFFLLLYKKVKSDDVCRYVVGSKKFAAQSSHDDSMKKLNELRNGFIHFFPTSWSVDLAVLPSVCLNCLDVAYFLGWESKTIIWHDSQLSVRAQRAITVLRATLRALDGVLRQ